MELQDDVWHCHHGEIEINSRLATHKETTSASDTDVTSSAADFSPSLSPPFHSSLPLISLPLLPLLIISPPLSLPKPSVYTVHSPHKQSRHFAILRWHNLMSESGSDSKRRRQQHRMPHSYLCHIPADITLIKQQSLAHSLTKEHYAAALSKHCIVTYS